MLDRQREDMYRVKSILKSIIINPIHWTSFNLIQKNSKNPNLHGDFIDGFGGGRSSDQSMKNMQKRKKKRERRTDEEREREMRIPPPPLSLRNSQYKMATYGVFADSY